MIEIMDVKAGTVIKNKRTGREFILGDYASDVARELVSTSYYGWVDYINRNTQDEYEIVEEISE